MTKYSRFLWMGLLTTSLWDGNSSANEILIERNRHQTVLNKTGQTDRKGLYQIVLYLQNPVNAPYEVIYYEIFSNKEISQINLIWESPISAEKAKKLFTNDFQMVLKEKEQTALGEEIRTFISFIPDFQPKDILSLRWNPGGYVEAWKNNKKIGEVRSLPFAKALWSLWLGSNSIVNRQQLISNYENVDAFTDF